VTTKEEAERKINGSRDPDARANTNIARPDRCSVCEHHRRLIQDMTIDVPGDAQRRGHVTGSTSDGCCGYC
jgi:hypothetical protein